MEATERVHNKYSTRLMHTTIEFLRACKEELGDKLGDEKVTAMIDAFDPALRHQIFMEMLLGNIGMVNIKVDLYHSPPRKKIAAIKAVRAITRFGLKEAKEIVDAAEQNNSAKIPGSYSLAAVREFREALAGTGYSAG